MPCDNCPIGPGCAGLRHKRYCELKANPKYRDLLFRLAGLDPEKPLDTDRPPVEITKISKTSIAPPSQFLAGTTGKIRLGFLAPNLNSGGAESVQLQQLKGLDKAKFDLVGLVVGDRMELTDASMTNQTSAYLPIQYGLDKIAGLASKCDLLISWMIEDIDSKVGSTPYIYIDHFPHSAPLNSIAQKCLKGAAAIVGVSTLCSPAWTGDSRYSVIPNAIDVGRLAITADRSTMLARWGVPSTALVAGSYCRVHLDRRPDAVIRALPLLPEPWHVVVVGEQNSLDELQYLQNLISQLPTWMRSRVHLMPEDSNSGNVLNAFDVVVSCASGATESFGLTMAEALWLNKPVVATPFGLAKMHPLFFYTTMLDDSPLNLALAIQLAKLGGPKLGAQAFIQKTYNPINFLASWNTLIAKVAPTKPPTVAAMAKSFTKAVIDHAVSGFEIAPQETQDNRESICQGCPKWISTSDTCQVCGCGLKLKRQWATSECPLKLW